MRLHVPEPAFRAAGRSGRGIDPAAWAFVREEEAGEGRDAVNDIFRCERCGEAIFPGETCVVFRHPKNGPRRCWCGGCAEEGDKLEGHLEQIGIRYFSGRAEDGEQWLAMRAPSV